MLTASRQSFGRHCFSIILIIIALSSVITFSCGLFTIESVFTFTQINWGMTKLFFSDTRGTVSLLIGGLLTVLVGAIGFAVEFARGIEIRIDMQDAADVAVIAATRNYAETGKEKEASLLAEKIFRDNFRSAETVQIARITFESVNGTEGSIQIDATVNPFFSPFAIMKPSVKASAAIAKEYLDVYLLVDRSHSMLLAEEGPDVDDLMALTKPMLLADTEGRHISEPEGCAFACHTLEGWEADGKSLYEHATENGIVLRSQRMTNAMRDVIADTFVDDHDTTRVGIVDFSLLQELSLMPTRDLASLEAALNRADDNLGPTTHYPELINFILTEMGSSGSGGRPDDARRVLVMATDGAHSWWAANGDAFYDVIDPAQCQQLKDAGYTLAILNTRYDPLDHSQRYDNFVGANAHLYAPALKNCASEDLYFEIGSGEDISAEFRKIASSIEPAPMIRLTQ